MVVRKATILDLEPIYLMAKTYYDSMNEEVQSRPPGTQWMVAEQDGVMACLSYSDEAKGQRWVLDAYGSKPGLQALKKWLLEDSKGKIVLGAVDPRNQVMNRFMQAKRRHYRWTHAANLYRLETD